MLSGAVLTAIALLTGCASEDSPDKEGPASGSKAIQFSAATEYSSRGEEYTTNNLSSFYVYAYLATDNSLFMKNVNVTKGSDNTWSYSPVKYWPDDAVNFYAYAPSGWVPSTGTLSAFSYENYGDQDLIYATALDRSQPAAGEQGQIKFNFRHALSRISATLNSTNSKVTVKVSFVAVVANHMGTFSFPTVSTDGTENSDGTWSDLSMTHAMPLYWAQHTDDVMTLTSTPVDPNSQGYMPQYALPQTLPWTDDNVKANDHYLELHFSVFDAETGAKLWPNKNTDKDDLVQGSTVEDGLVRFPLSTGTITEWKPGYHYIYNITINGQSDMQPIEFGQPTVEGYIDVDTSFSISE